MSSSLTYRRVIRQLLVNFENNKVFPLNDTDQIVQLLNTPKFINVNEMKETWWVIKYQISWKFSTHQSKIWHNHFDCFLAFNFKYMTLVYKQYRNFLTFELELKIIFARILFYWSIWWSSQVNFLSILQFVPLLLTLFQYSVGTLFNI